MRRCRGSQDLVRDRQQLARDSVSGRGGGRAALGAEFQGCKIDAVPWRPWRPKFAKVHSRSFASCYVLSGVWTVSRTAVEQLRENARTVDALRAAQSATASSNERLTSR